MDAVLIARFSPGWTATAVNPIIEVLSGFGRGGSKAVGLVAPVVFSLPASPHQADAPPCQAAFFCPVFTPAGYRHTCACELASIARMPDP